MSLDQNKRNRLLADLPGIALGFQILVKGYEKLPYFSHFPLHIGFLFLAGGFIIFGTLFHHRLEKRFKNVHALFHLIEGAVLIVSALILFEKGKIRIPLFMLFIGLIYLALGIFSYSINRANNVRIGRSFLLWLGRAFMAAGLLAVGLNLQHDRNGWVFGIGGLFFAMGLFYALCTGWLLARLLKEAGVHQEPPPPEIEGQSE